MSLLSIRSQEDYPSNNALRTGLSNCLQNTLRGWRWASGLVGQRANLPQTLLVLFGKPRLGVRLTQLDQPAQQLRGEEQRAEQLAIERAVSTGHDATQEGQVAVAQQAAKARVARAVDVRCDLADGLATAWADEDVGDAPLAPPGNATDAAVVLQNRPFQIGQRGDLRAASFLLDVGQRDSLATHVALDRHAILDQDDGPTLGE